jgi:hypothetical protein
MPKSDNKKDNGMAIAMIGLVGTLVAAALGSPVLVEWIRSRQGTATPPAVVTQVSPIETATPDYTEQILIFREDFDNDNVSGFAYQGNWQVGKDKNNRILENAGPGTAIFGPSDFTHGIIEFRARISGDGFAAVNFRTNGGSAYALAFAENQMVLGFRESGNPVRPFSSETTRALVFEKDAWYLVRVEVRGAEMIVFVDNNRIMSARDNLLSKGGLSFSVDAGTQAAFDDVKVWDLK